MKIELRSFSRLTIIFILAVTIPGSILTYLSIQNISNLKELTEKKVLEEEKILADLIYQNFQNKLVKATQEFSTYISIIDKQNYASIRFSDTIGFIDNPFITDSTGKFLWPNLNPGNASKRDGKSSTQFKRNIATAEKFEFIDQNYPAAKTAYLLALNAASGKSDSAKATNAIARLLVKDNNDEEALKYYSLLISNFHRVLDKNGLPYINYATPQLIHISNESNSLIILHKINSVLKLMVSGEIPLNYSTRIILDEILEWITTNSSLIADDIKKTKEHIFKIKNQISFYLNNKKVIEDYVLQNTLYDTTNQINEYSTLTGVSDSSEEALMIRYIPDRSYICGFTINLEELAHHSLTIEFPPTVKFEYSFEIVNTKIKSIPRDEYLVTISKISPLIPNNSLLIKLKDDNTIKENVTRTSWIYGIAITLLLGGMILGVYLIIKDINREKHLSQLRSDFVSNVTHELKTPLTSIYMFAESIMLGRVKTKSDQKEYLGIILKETDRLKRLINNILDFSKREKGKLVYHCIEVNISEVIKSAIHDLDYWIIEKKFSVRSKIEEDIFGYADPDAIKQAVINLLSNAMKYSRDRKEVLVKLWKKGELIYIQVEDKGIGIPEDQLDSIFDKFYRVENNNNTEVSGTGLGLTVVKDIVQAHKARILVESKINEGSIFTIILKSVQ